MYCAIGADFVSGTGAEGTEKRRDVDGFERVGYAGMSPIQLTAGSREHRN